MKKFSIIVLVLGLLAIPVMGQFQISNQPGWNYFGSVAFDGTNYLVVWQNYLPGTGIFRVYAARVTTEGVVLDPNGIFLADGGVARVSAVAFDGLNYLVAWDTLQERSNSAIYAARIGMDGVVLDPQGILVSPAEGFGVNYPTVAFNGTNHIVVWQRIGVTAGGIFCARMATNGTVLDVPRITVALPSGSYSQVSLPAVASGAQNFLAVWQALRPDNTTDDIRGSRITDAGSVLDPTGLNISTAPETRFSSTVGYDGTNYLVVWADGRNGNNDIYGSRVSPAGTVLDPSGIPIVTVAGSQYNPSVAFDGFNYLVAWPDLRSGKNEVYGAHLRPDGTVVEPNGYLIQSRIPAEAVASGLAFGFGQGLITWEDYDLGASQLYGVIIP